MSTGTSSAKRANRTTKGVYAAQINLHSIFSQNQMNPIKHNYCVAVEFSCIQAALLIFILRLQNEYILIISIYKTMLKILISYSAYIHLPVFVSLPKIHVFANASRSTMKPHRIKLENPIYLFICLIH